SPVMRRSQARGGARRIASAAGPNRLVEGKLVGYRMGNALTNDSVWSMAADRDGSIWLGTDGGGLNRWKDGGFQSYTTGDGLVNDIVLAMYLDRDDTLWIGTSGGFRRVRGGGVKRYTTKGGSFAR